MFTDGDSYISETQKWVYLMRTFPLLTANVKHLELPLMDLDVPQCGHKGFVFNHSLNRSALNHPSSAAEECLS